ncbi:MAG: hypothetical protein KatS3mg090_0665 [Patescibacteria group bacterium]|nr:MAG: hypothetical protein KatS3mg090_0665 [Patescibacteria group bacterium]
MKNIYRVITLTLFLIALLSFVFFAKGYRFDSEKVTITSTGIVSISSQPKASKIYINDEFKGVTDQNLNLKPGNYTIKITSDGYTSWQKNINLTEGVVLSLHAHLFSKNPGLKPLTSIGIKKIVQLDNVPQFIVLTDNLINSDNKNNLVLLNLESPIISLQKGIDPIINIQTTFATDSVDLNHLKLSPSPDFTQLLIEYEKENLLVDLKTKETFANIDKDQLQTNWNEEIQKEKSLIIKSFPKELQTIASNSADILKISPDENKILYKAKSDAELPLAIKPTLPISKDTLNHRNIVKNKVYIYDKKNDKNYLIKPLENIDIENKAVWHTDSQHIIFIEGNQIKVVDADGENSIVVYSGPFEKNFISSSPRGNIFLLINLNNNNNPYADLYEIEIN